MPNAGFARPLGEDALKPRVKIAEFKLPTSYAGPTHITPAAHGAKELWFTEYDANAIGLISTDGKIIEHQLGIRAPHPGAQAPQTPSLVISSNARPIPMVTVPPDGNSAYGITVGPDNNVWFTDTNNGANEIGRIAGNRVDEYRVSTQCCLQDILTGPDKALWFPISNTQYDPSTNYLGRITTAGKVHAYALSYDSGPANMTVGPDKLLWFTEYTGNKIGKASTSGKVEREYTLPQPSEYPSDITSGPDGALWFTEWVGNKIGRITTAGKITEFKVPTAQCAPSGIVVGPDKALWFTEASGNKIGRITTKGAISEYPIPTSKSEPFFIVLGPDHNLWFTEYHRSKIGRVTVIK
ncbi:MAG TPA: hypothetical protein VMF61_05370 [Candidatus Acidoferrales bacterium]|nr:hypothetical protein [Candidatus Acidoferrales bacterium]